MMKIKVVIIDYDAGNLRNIQKALEYCGCMANISQSADEIQSADALLLPGVGAFAEGIASLQNLGLDILIKNLVLEQAKPILGICLGMQLLCETSCENGQHQGLGILPFKVQRLTAEQQNLSVPHMGWNSVSSLAESCLYKDIPAQADFYFAHSYHVVGKRHNVLTAHCHYGSDFIASLECQHIFATQFHPEKSQRYGLQLLTNFKNMVLELKTGEQALLC